jgi:16S rRNA (guanine527-N7)-methyltransferase
VRPDIAKTTRAAPFHVKHFCAGRRFLRYARAMPTSAKARPMLAVSGPADFAAAFGVSRETVARLETYEALLRQWQKAINLVAARTLEAVWQRHFADSAQLVALAPPGARSWLDLGSGAGFPGLVVAILLAEPPRPGLPTPQPGSGCVTLIESDSRKAAFLGTVARQTGIAVDILSTRIETCATQSRVAPPDVVTARALAPLDKLLSLAAPLLSPRTVGLFLKGRQAAKEVEAARKAWTFNSALIPSSTEAEAHIVRVSTLEPNWKEPRS